MDISLGVHVGASEVTAVLVDTGLPDLGPIAARTQRIADVPGGPGDAVATLIGILRVQAMRSDLEIFGSAVVCEEPLQRKLVTDALVNHGMTDVDVLDIDDERLSRDYPLETGAALIASTSAPSDWTDSPLDDFAYEPTSSQKSTRVAMIAVGAAVFLAMSGATVWALSLDGPAEDQVIGTADISYAQQSPTSSQSVVVDRATGNPVIDPATGRSVVIETATGRPVSIDTSGGQALVVDAATGAPVAAGAVPYVPGTPWTAPPEAAPTRGQVVVPDDGAGGGGGGGNTGGGNTGGGNTGGGNAGGWNPGGGDTGGGNTGGGNTGGGNTGGGNTGGGNTGGGNTGGGNTGGGDTDPDPTTDPTTAPPTESPVNPDPVDPDPVDPDPADPDLADPDPADPDLTTDTSVASE